MKLMTSSLLIHGYRRGRKADATSRAETNASTYPIKHGSEKVEYTAVRFGDDRINSMQMY